MAKHAADPNSYNREIEELVTSAASQIVRQYIVDIKNGATSPRGCPSSRMCCAPCSSECTGETGWQPAGVGYQKNTASVCQCGACKTADTYRCDAGYWGTNTDGVSGCTKCPSSGLSAAGATALDQCYTTSGKDSSGNYEFKSMCYYK